MSTTATCEPEIRPGSERLGAEVVGFDASAPMNAERRAWLEAALQAHPLLAFPNQALDAATLRDFASALGPLKPHILRQYRHPEIPEVSYLTNVAEDGGVDREGVRRATDWHTDETYTERPPLAAFLYALEVPSEGGGTLFADMYGAYAALPVAHQERLSTLTGLHRYAAGPRGHAALPIDEDQKPEYPTVRHRAVRRHPVTGEPYLFVNGIHTFGFDGMAADEGYALVEELIEHATRPEHIHYHRWHPRTLIMWDERTTMHRSAGDYPPRERRVMLRAIVRGKTGL